MRPNDITLPDGYEYAERDGVRGFTIRGERFHGVNSDRPEDIARAAHEHVADNPGAETWQPGHATDLEAELDDVVSTIRTKLGDGSYTDTTVSCDYTWRSGIVCFDVVVTDDLDEYLPTHEVVPRLRDVIKSMWPHPFELRYEQHDRRVKSDCPECKGDPSYSYTSFDTTTRCPTCFPDAYRRAMPERPTRRREAAGLAEFVNGIAGDPRNLASLLQQTSYPVVDGEVSMGYARVPTGPMEMGGREMSMMIIDDPIIEPKDAEAQRDRIRKALDLPPPNLTAPVFRTRWLPDHRNPPPEPSPDS